MKMKKQKLKAINNNEDSVWFMLEPTLESINIIHEIFDIDPTVYEKIESEEKPKYEDYIGNELFGGYEESKVTAYFIANENVIHLILRKKGEYEKIKEKILDKFEFIKRKDKQQK